MKSYHDVTGDGGARVLEQVSALRSRVAENLAGVGRHVAIASGKGGVGKSTLTHQLALAATRAGQRVAVLDADLNGPSQARIAGLRSTPPLPGTRGLALPRSVAGIGVVSMGSVIPEGSALELPSVASGDSQTWRATAELTFFYELLATVEWGELDLLLYDLPPGAERTVQYVEALGPRTEVVLVTIPSQLSYGVVARSVAALGQAGVRPLGYVENMSGYYCAQCQAVKPLFPASPDADPGLQGLPCLGRVPFDPDVASLCDHGELERYDRTRPAARVVEGVLAAILASAPRPATAI
jgi:ATP-binding protein involved in chromosome partitioning